MKKKKIHVKNTVILSDTYKQNFLFVVCELLKQKGERFFTKYILPWSTFYVNITIN